MKSAITFMTILVLATSTAYASTYLVLENVGLQLEPSLEIGWELEARNIDLSNLSIEGRFYVSNENLAAFPTPWVGGFNLGLVVGDDAAHDIFEVGLGMDARLMPGPSLESIELSEWTTTVHVASYPSPAITLYGTIDLGYEVANPPGPGGWVGIWNFTPTIGLEYRWP